MDDTTQAAAPPTSEQGGGAPAPPSEREKQLDTQLKAVTKERDKLKSQVGTLTTERDNFKGQVEQVDRARVAAETERNALQAEKDAASQPKADESAASEADEYAETKAIMRRNGLTTAWVLPSGEVCFQESHAKHVAGEGFDSLTLISAE